MQPETHGRHRSSPRPSAAKPFRRPAVSSLFTPDTPLSPCMPYFPLQLASPLDRGLLNHFLTIVSPLLSRRSSPSANPYNSYLMPMAHQNETVLHCILALSGTHWRNMQPDMGNRGLFHRSQAALANMLSHIDKTSVDVTLTCSLLLCMAELFDGTSESWQFHLAGAAALLTASRQHNHSAWTGRRNFLLQLAGFLDSAAAMSTCRPPVIQDGAAGTDGTTAVTDETELAVYGIPKALFHLVDQVSGLARKCRKCADAPSKALLRQEAAHVEDRIRHWSCADGGSQTVSALRFTDESIIHAATAFEHALRLRLHQVVEGYALNSPKVAQAVDAIICSVQSIRYGSPLESCLLFPLAMAGSSCCKPERRIIVQDRLKVMEWTCGFGHVCRTRVLVEEVWSRRGSEGMAAAIVDWTCIRDDKMRGLVVF
jgi:transcriptional activator protein UGA3